MEFDGEYDVSVPEDVILPAPAQPTESISKNYQGMLFLWIMFCVFSFSWFVKKLFRGRTKMRTDFVTIEEQLKRLQMSLEKKDFAANPEKFDEAISNLTSMTALDPVQEQDGGQEENCEINGNEEEEKETETDFKIIEEIVEEEADNVVEDKKNL